MKRRLTIELEVGSPEDFECGECPFRALDWEGGVPTGRYLCTCPAWETQEVTRGRHRACIEAGDDLEGTTQTCGRPCDAGSPCVLHRDHAPADRHETAHGCIFYDVELGVPAPGGES